MGAGEQIPEGTIIDTSQTIYYYVQTTTQPNCTDNLSFHIQVQQTEVDELQDVLLCEGEFYELPQLVNGNYFTETLGAGNQLNPGDIIDSSQTI